MKSFFAKVWGFFSSLFGSGTKLNNTILGTLKFSAIAVEGVLAVVDPAVEPAAAEVLNEIQTDFGLASGLVGSVTGSDLKTQLTNLFTGINSNLSQLLQAGHIKDAALTQKVTALAGVISQELSAILGAL